VVEEGTARRAQLDGIPAAGKTGTTNAFRDAWFVGYTGNFTGAVWYGNDDYSPTNRMTGGSLPAQTWHDIMVVAHQGVEIRDVAGIGPAKRLTPQPSAAAAAKAQEVNAGPPPILTRHGADILVQVEKLMDDAARSVSKTSLTAPAQPKAPAKPSPSTSLASPNSIAAATPTENSTGGAAVLAARKN
jgi:penicillin-binding protein 1A